MASPSGVLLALLATAGGLAAPAAALPRFREMAETWGLAFRHHHGGSGQRYMVESMVGGVAILDYDSDGDQDVFFVDGGPLPGYTGEAPRSRLFRNDGGRFVDVTERAGIVVRGYGSGAVAGDVDSDGDLDLCVTAFGPITLLRNEGDGTFHEVSASARLADDSWSSSAAFADADRDGDLDLYVTGYVDFRLDNHQFCGDRRRGIRAHCTPEVYRPLPDRFYRNQGDGTFRDDTRLAGLSEPLEGGAGLGVTFGDLTGDGWPDLYVANDLDPNFLFVNRGDGTFEDASLVSGAAFSETGKAEAGMGLAVADLDDNGLFDLMVTNFELETNGVYLNQGQGLFVDRRYASGLAEPSLRKLGFGAAFGDFDHDGDEDLAVANGHVLDNAEEMGSPTPYRQANQVFAQGPRGRFQEVPGSGMDAIRPSRGLALGDLDGDGDLDVVIVNLNEVAEVYENLAGSAGGWLLLDLQGGGNSSAVGAVAELHAAGTAQLREVRTGTSYLSHHALPLHFGTGQAPRVERLRVRWPNGRRSEWRQLPTGYRLRLIAPAR
jgi:enediyne biosynthesis protein E4